MIPCHHQALCIHSGIRKCDSDASSFKDAIPLALQIKAVSCHELDKGIRRSLWQHQSWRKCLSVPMTVCPWNCISLLQMPLPKCTSSDAGPEWLPELMFLPFHFQQVCIKRHGQLMASKYPAWPSCMSRLPSCCAGCEAILCPTLLPEGRLRTSTCGQPGCSTPR